MDDGVLIHISKIERRFATMLAEQRAAKNGSKKFSTHSETSSHYIGLLGEFAFWKMFNVEPDLETFAGGDAGHDFESNDTDNTLEVKTRWRVGMPLDLLVRPDRALATFYVLAEIEERSPEIVRLVGWCNKEMLMKRKEKFATGERYIVSRGSLLPIMDIEKLIGYKDE